MALSRETLAKRIADALSRHSMKQTDLAAAIGMDPTALNKALSAKRNFGSLEIALIAEVLHLSTDRLLEDEGTQPQPLPMAARLQQGESPAVGQAIVLAQELAELDALLNEVGHPASPARAWEVPRTGSAIDQGTLLAQEVRSDVRLGDQPLPPEPETFARWVEDLLNIDVYIAPLHRGIDGLALTSDALRLALVSSATPATRQRFTLAHEICHILCRDATGLLVDESVFGRRDLVEIRANAFAAAFLMPGGLLRTAVSDGVTEAAISGLLGTLRVSVDALAYRLFNLELVNERVRDEIRSWSSATIGSRPGRTDDLQARGERRIPSLLLTRAFDAFAAGAISVRPLANLVQADPDQLLDELTPPRFPVEPIDADAPAYAL